MQVFVQSGGAVCVQFPFQSLWDKASRLGAGRGGGQLCLVADLLVNCSLRDNHHFFCNYFWETRFVLVFEAR